MTDKIKVIPAYHSAAHYITEPDKLATCSRYFVRRWLPELGGTGTQIVLVLRSLGYFNWRDGETRDGIEIELRELAALVGVCVATIKREFGQARPAKGDASGAARPLQNPALHQFVKRDRQYWRDPVTNRLLRTANVYRVMMDDPIHPADLTRYQEILEGLEKGQRPKAQCAPKMPGAVASKAQLDSKKNQMEPKKSQLDSELSPIAPTLIDYSSLQKNTSPTAALPGDSLALFEEQEKTALQKARAKRPDAFAFVDKHRKGQGE